MPSERLTAQVCIAMPTGNIPEASEVGTPLHSGHLFTQDTLDGTNGVHIIEVPLYFDITFQVHVRGGSLMPRVLFAEQENSLMNCMCIPF